MNANIDQMVIDLSDKLKDKYNGARLDLETEHGSYPILYVHFNDTYNHSLIVSRAKSAPNCHTLAFTDARCLKSDTVKASTNWTHKMHTTDSTSINDLVDFFHKCYEQIVSEIDSFDKECDKLLKPLNLNRESLYGKTIRPGEAK